MNRRQFLSALAAGVALPVLARAADLPSVQPNTIGGPRNILLEVVNFHCPRCRAVNDYLPQIEAQAANLKLPVRVAPLAWEGQSLWPDRVYYATRDLFPGTEAVMRDAFFDGIQGEGLAFDDLPEVLSFIQTRGLLPQLVRVDPKFNLEALADYATSNAPLVSEMKAGRLVGLSMAQEVPVFIWIGDGKILHTITPADAADPGSLVKKVLAQLQ